MLDQVAAAVGPEALLDVDADPVHHRAVVSLAGSAETLEERLLDLVETATRLIDLRAHEGVHPRVGAADVVPVVPLSGRLDDAASLARRIGERIHRELRLPVYFYGAALGGPSLASIRAGRVAPDLRAGLGAAGAVCVGARPALVAYNVLLPGADFAAAAELARGLRATAPGGLAGVQALAFRVGDAVQLSMNLVDVGAAPPGLVLDEVRRRAARAGIAVGEDEVVGLCPARCAPPAARGRVLEARLAATAARRGARAAAARPGEEHARLALRLDAAADELGRLGPDGDELLVAAERAAALARVLRAGAVDDGEALALLDHAARQLRAAVPGGVAQAAGERLRLLDLWLNELR